MSRHVEVPPKLVSFAGDWDSGGTTAYRQVLADQRPLDLLLVNRGASTLVVSFHGALKRDKFVLPRFERVATFTQRDVNVLAIADPGLHAADTQLAKRLELTWYTGPLEYGYGPVLQEWILRAAQYTQSDNIIVTGSSGGGFAALQIAPMVGAVALVFNPQTQIHRYVLPSGSVWAQRNYLEAMAPSLSLPVHDLGKVDWTAPWGDRLSCLKRYEGHGPADVLYLTNINDWHHEQHFIPFRDRMDALGYGASLREVLYVGESGHIVPERDQVLQALDAIIANDVSLDPPVSRCSGGGK